ncbi:Short-chain dehydrogenase [hydrothermal vent metagenome]|uniref:Short-chain dehydrogenase n=1 Tax=hydrothermal vent metagenome TaxID=652676 RepID=A0A3B1A815_9ZZZZ
MKNLWNEQEAMQCKSELALRVYTSRLLGRAPDLVLHGGGNTSVKINQKNILGHEETLLYVKGSGWDLATIEAAGFPAVNLDHLKALAELESLSDPDMVNELKTHTTNASAPTPSVEAILHAILPFKYVDHTHADAVVTITNTPDGLNRIKSIYDDVVIVPYVMPGFDLARICAQAFAEQSNDRTIGMVLMNHGIFSFADNAKDSYQRMIELVTRAEEYLKDNNAWQIDIATADTTKNKYDIILQAEMRNKLSAVAEKPMILHAEASAEVFSFIARNDIEEVSQQGPATPDHVIRTKQLPMLNYDIAKDLPNYLFSYKKYFEKNSKKSKSNVTTLDPAPRVVLDKDLGLCTLGNTIIDALINRDIYQHTIKIIQRATMLEQYQALPGKEIFAVEYWDLEQAKLKKSGKRPEFEGEVALVTGAASGIGKACVDSLLKRGAAVIALDIDSKVSDLFPASNYCGLVCDVTSQQAIEQALDQGVRKFGGVDMVILNAGIFPASATIDDLDIDLWNRTLDINLTANLRLLKAVHPLLNLAPRYGRVVIIGSKNVPAPGPGASAYSVSKAALNQLMRVVALEWSDDKIRINAVHPNAVFDTNIWTKEILQARAASYQMSVAEYKTRNLLKTEISSHDVAELVAEMCGPLFAKTTAAQLPIDGGDLRVI